MALPCPGAGRPAYEAGQGGFHLEGQGPSLVLTIYPERGLATGQLGLEGVTLTSGSPVTQHP